MIHTGTKGLWSCTVDLPETHKQLYIPEQRDTNNYISDQGDTNNYNIYQSKETQTTIYIYIRPERHTNNYIYIRPERHTNNYIYIRLERHTNNYIYITDQKDTKSDQSKEAEECSSKCYDYLCPKGFHLLFKFLGRTTFGSLLGLGIFTAGTSTHRRTLM